MPAARLSPMKPWLAAVTLSMLPLAKAGLDPKAGADVVLRASAAGRGSRIEGFDTPEEQVRYLADLPEAEQLAFLENVLDRAAGGTDLPNRIAAAWESGDLAAIDSILNAELKSKTPSLYRRLLVDRNSRYAERIEALPAGKEDRFVAVGVGHLVGVDSIQAFLGRKGGEAPPDPVTGLRGAIGTPQGRPAYRGFGLTSAPPRSAAAPRRDGRLAPCPPPRS